MKVLNLYAGLGGNRKLWPKEAEVTAVEINPLIAAQYARLFPGDEVVVGDAHHYLLEHFRRYGFIWASPPCPSHSRSRYWRARGDDLPPVYPDMKLWQEILFLQHYAVPGCLWVVENVVPYYVPLVAPTVQLQRHCFWSNFKIQPHPLYEPEQNVLDVTSNSTHFGYNLEGVDVGERKDRVLRNLVNPDIGLYVYEQAIGKHRQANVKPGQLF
jgi:DNA (cytosine-5)-methyltransferase 1